MYQGSLERSSALLCWACKDRVASLELSHGYKIDDRSLNCVSDVSDIGRKEAQRLRWEKVANSSMGATGKLFGSAIKRDKQPAKRCESV